METESTAAHRGSSVSAACSDALKIADAIEAKVQDVVASSSQANSPPERSIIKSARRPSNTSKATTLEHVRAPKDVCPHIRVSVYANKPSSKWGSSSQAHQVHVMSDVERKLSSKLTTGYMMVDTGASITILSQKWCAVHGVQVMTTKNKPSVYAANGTAISITGTASFTLRLSPSLEIDLADVAVQDCGDYYSALLGMDVLSGRKGVLGPAEIKLAPMGEEGAKICFKLIQSQLLTATKLLPTHRREQVNQIASDKTALDT